MPGFLERGPAAESGREGWASWLASPVSAGEATPNWARDSFKPSIDSGFAASLMLPNSLILFVLW